MVPKKSLGEVFAEVRKKIKHADKIEVLRANAAKPVFYLLSLSYRDDVKFLLPEGSPPYEPFKGKKWGAPTDLQNELRRFYLFLAGGEPGLKQLKREVMFARMLADMEAEDTELALAVKDKAIEKVYRLPRKVVEEAFPGLLTHSFNIHFNRPQ